jgi:hypothetical protein
MNIRRKENASGLLECRPICVYKVLEQQSFHLNGEKTLDSQWMYVSIFKHVEMVLTVARNATVNMLVGQMSENVTNNTSYDI